MADFEETLKRPVEAFRPTLARLDPVAPKRQKPPKITAPVQLVSLFHEGFLAMDEQEKTRLLAGINDHDSGHLWALPMRVHTSWHAANAILLAMTWRSLVSLPGTPPVVAGREVPLAGVEPKSYRSSAYLLMKRAVALYEWYTEHAPHETPPMADLEAAVPVFVRNDAPTLTVPRKLMVWLLEPRGDERAQVYPDRSRQTSAAATLAKDFDERFMGDDHYLDLHQRFLAYVTDARNKRGITLTWGRDNDAVDTLAEVMDWVVAHSTGTVKGSEFFYIRQEVYDLRRLIEAFGRDGLAYEAPAVDLTLPIRVPTWKDLSFFHLIRHAEDLDNERTDANINNEFEGQRDEPKVVSQRRSFTPPPQQPKRRFF